MALDLRHTHSSDIFLLLLSFNFSKLYMGLYCRLSPFRIYIHSTSATLFYLTNLDIDVPRTKNLTKNSINHLPFKYLGFTDPSFRKLQKLQKNRISRLSISSLACRCRRHILPIGELSLSFYKIISLHFILKPLSHDIQHLWWISTNLRPFT